MTQTTTEPAQEPQSLLKAAEEQAAAAPFLFPELNESIVYQSLAAHGHFTGAGLFEKAPETYRLIVRMAAEGLSTRMIARACGVSHNTVEAVRRREGASVDALKEEILTIVRSAARLCAERVFELAPSMDARDASVALGILVEKLQLLSGEATVIIGQLDDRVKHDDFNKLLEALPLAEAHEVAPEMGFGASAAQQTAVAASPAPPAPPAQAAAPAAPESPPSDEESIAPPE